MWMDYLCGHRVCVLLHTHTKTEWEAKKTKTETKHHEKLERKVSFLKRRENEKKNYVTKVCYTVPITQHESCATVYAHTAREKRIIMKILWSVMWSQWFEI